MEKYTLISGDIHKLVKIKKDEEWTKYAWRIHSHDDYYYIPVKDECKHGFNPKTDGYKRKRVFWAHLVEG
jgi:hypothetical protein